jgi:hypothetical protein
MGYWSLVDPIWEKVSIYDGPDVFLEQYNASPEASRILFAAHWCQSEINNGGFEQFFSNSTGVLAPEGVQAFRTIGMPQTADLIEEAMAAFGPSYPRERGEREEALEAIWDAAGDSDAGPFGNLDETFFKLIETENGGFDVAADSYAASNG